VVGSTVLGPTLVYTSRPILQPRTSKITTPCSGKRERNKEVTSPSLAAQQVSSPGRRPTPVLVPSVPACFAQASPSPIWPRCRYSFDVDPLLVTLAWPFVSCIAFFCGSWSHFVVEGPSACWIRHGRLHYWHICKASNLTARAKQNKNLEHNTVQYVCCTCNR